MYKRIWLLGDLHAGVHSNSNEWFQNMISYFEDYFIPKLKEFYEEGDILMMPGDINDNNQIIRTEISNKLIDIFTEISSIIPVKIIIGNHDIVKKYTNEVNSVRPIGMIDGVEVIKSPKEIRLINGEKILMLPWCHSVEDEAAAIEKTEASYMLSHAHFMGMAFTDEYVYKNKGGEIISNPLKILNKFRRVWNGHIHKPEVFNNVRNLGIPYQMKWTDHTYECGITVYDIKEKKEVFIKNEFSPVFKYFSLSHFLDMHVEDIEKEIKNSYVRVTHPMSLRKLLDLEVIYDHISGYKSLEFVPTKDKNKKDLEFETSESFDTDNSMEVINVIDPYIDGLVEDDDTKNKLRQDLKELYKLASK